MTGIVGRLQVWRSEELRTEGDSHVYTPVHDKDYWEPFMRSLGVDYAYGIQQKNAIGLAGRYSNYDAILPALPRDCMFIEPSTSIFKETLDRIYDGQTLGLIWDGSQNEDPYSYNSNGPFCTVRVFRLASPTWEHLFMAHAEAGTFTERQLGLMMGPFQEQHWTMHLGSTEVSFALHIQEAPRFVLRTACPYERFFQDTEMAMSAITGGSFLEDLFDLMSSEEVRSRTMEWLGRD